MKDLLASIDLDRKEPARTIHKGTVLTIRALFQTHVVAEVVAKRGHRCTLVVLKSTEPSEVGGRFFRDTGWLENSVAIELGDHL